MKVIILQKAWDLKFGNPGKGFEGHCDHPEQKRKKIIVDKKLSGLPELDATLHELGHAGNWNAAEEYIDEYYSDVSKILWKLGYRRLTKEQMKTLEIE